VRGQLSLAPWLGAAQGCDAARRTSARCVLVGLLRGLRASAAQRPFVVSSSEPRCLGVV